MDLGFRMNLQRAALTNFFNHCSGASIFYFSGLSAQTPAGTGVRKERCCAGFHFVLVENILIQMAKWVVARKHHKKKTFCFAGGGSPFTPYPLNLRLTPHNPKTACLECWSDSSHPTAQRHKSEAAPNPPWRPQTERCLKGTSLALL